MFEDKMPNDEELAQIKEFINLNSRMDTRENAIDRHTNDEFKAACHKAILDFNTIPPASEISFSQIKSSMMTYSLYLSIVTRNLLWTLIADWTYHGNEIMIDDLVEIDRLNRYRELWKEIDDEIKTNGSNIKRDSGLVKNPDRLVSVSDTFSLGQRSVYSFYEDLLRG